MIRKTSDPPERKSRPVITKITEPAKIETSDNFDSMQKHQYSQALFAGAVLARRFGIRVDRAMLIAQIAGFGGGA